VFFLMIAKPRCMTKRVLIGGCGNFGGHIARRLAREAGLT
jgi:prephenate dehydrogenase